jgi:hypothetical protein
VSEREQNDPDGIDFDFFDDAPTADGLRDQAPPRRGPRIPQRPPGSNAPLLRLAALIAGAIILVVVLVLWVNACRSDQKKAQYEDYMAEVQKIGADSAQVGKDLNALIFSSGIQLEELQTQLDGLREAQSQTVARAEDLDAPGPLRMQHQDLIKALQLRVSGLNGLSSAFGQVTGAENSDETGTLLAEQSWRLIASDVNWEDFFEAPSKSVLEEQGVSGVAVPASHFVTNAELGSPTSWKLVVDRLTKPPGEGGAGLRGNRIAGVRVQPADTALKPQPEENTVTTSDDLAIEVLVENSGDSQETQVKVTLTIQQAPEPLKGEQIIQSINPGDTKSVTFKMSDLGTPALATRTIVKVTVEPVDGETNTNNNVAEYVVFFSL